MSAIRWVDPRDGVEVELVEPDGRLVSCAGCRYCGADPCPNTMPIVGAPSCGDSIWRPVAAPAPAAAAPDGYRVNADHTAAVSTDTTWRSDMDRCPRGVRVLLLARDGCAVIGEYRGEAGFAAWHPMPRRGAAAGEGGER